MGGPQQGMKSFDINKRLVFEAWEKVQANAGSPGVDAVSIGQFRASERGNLYKLWNRMSAGSYMPVAVRAVEIPKDHGAGVRVLGVPTVADRVAQTAAAMLLEERLEPIFHRDSYGSRRQPSPRSTHESRSSPHLRTLGSALHRTVAHRPDADARWSPRRPRQGNPAGFSGLTVAGQPIHALRARFVDGPESSGLSVRALCG